jgi:hypothetical protein
MTAASQTVPGLDCRQVDGLSDVLVQRRCGHHRRYQHGMADRERRRRWASWDPREQKARFEGDFVTGAKRWSTPTGAPAGTFTITAVEPERMRANEAGIPFGRLRGENRYQPLADGKIRVSKRVGGTGRSVRYAI